MRESGGDDPALFLVHGNSHSAEYFARQIDGPLGKRFRVVAPDLPGHGDSPRAPNPEATYSLPGYVDAVQRVAAALDLGPTIFAGHCLGGHILIQASPGLPDLAGLVLFGTPPLPDLSRAGDGYLPNPCMELLFRERLSPEDTALLARTQIAGPSAQQVDLIARMIQTTDPAARTCLGESLFVRGEWADEWDLLETLDKPVRVLHGTRDAVIDAAYLADLPVDSVRQEGIRLLDGTGHSPHLEVPEVFEREISAFAERCFGLNPVAATA